MEEKAHLESRLDEIVRHYDYLEGYNVLNEMFKIDGELATISGFILGSKDSNPDWEQTNAALGQCVLLCSYLARKYDFTSERYKLVPNGSTSYLIFNDQGGSKKN